MNQRVVRGVAGNVVNAAGRGSMCLALAAGLVMCVAAPVLGQSVPKEPLDVNKIQPAPEPPPKPATPKADQAPPADKAAGQAQPAGDAAQAAPVASEPTYQVSRFVVEYKSSHPDHPPVEDLTQALVTLGTTPDGYTAPREGQPTVTMRVSDIAEGNTGRFARSAINAVGAAIVGELGKRGLAGAFVEISPDDIDPTTLADKRKDGRTDMRLIVWMGRISTVRTIAAGDEWKDELEHNPAARINNDSPSQSRIRELSPIQPGDLLHKDDLDNYVFRLNRHPDRRVDVALSPGDQQEDVVLDYLVSENKPWTVYAQFSNTGTKTTNRWRERFGFVDNQLTGHDDILRLDYSTAAFKASHAVLGSYEFPIITNYLRVRGYGAYTEFNASDIGQNADKFTGKSGTWGVEVTGTPWQYRETFLDIVGGLRFKSEEIANSLTATTGRENFYFPYVGARLSRDTDASSTLLSGTFEFMDGGWSGLDVVDEQRLGRQNVDASWQVLKFEATHSFYIEPLLNPEGYAGGSSEGQHTLAHEIYASFRGQYAFNNRLVPSEEDVLGGTYTVRGYPESIVAGDSVWIATLEYRFHVPRALGFELKEDANGKRWEGAEPGTWNGRELTSVNSLLGSSFRYTPQQPFGRADWDWVLKAFVDVGRNTNSRALVGETDSTLVGLGLGTELQIGRNLSTRLDWGIAAKSIDDPANPVRDGHSEVHFSITLLY
ncbi:MAG: hypothetical protein GC200_01610 [Tepidisphaera sp.]|nr:hypothetical protein [Tepidisphaera sp.]